MMSLRLCSVKFLAARFVRHYSVQLRGRPHLAGSGSETFPKYLSGPRDDFPLTVQASDVGVTNAANAQECAAAVHQTLEPSLLKHGAVLYRGFPLSGPDDFSLFHANLGYYAPVGYVGGAAVRHQVGTKGNVYTASGEHRDYNICLHNEMAYLPKWPKLVLFFCETPPAEGCGGESVIADVREIRSKLDKNVVYEFISKGCMYHYNWRHEKTEFNRTWPEVFQTEIKDKVEGILSSSCDGFRWESDGSISYWNTKPATITHPITDETLWFNHASRKHATVWTCHPHWGQVNAPYTGMPTHSYYGDGSDIPEDVIQHIRDVSWQCAVGFQMEKGDVLVMENNFVQHARMSFTGERRLLAALLEDAK